MQMQMTQSFVELSEAGVSTLKNVNHCFELVSGLNVNWRKSSVSGISIGDQDNLLPWPSSRKQSLLYRILATCY